VTIKDNKLQFDLGANSLSVTLTELSSALTTPSNLTIKLTKGVKA